MNPSYDYGMWPMVIISSLVFIIFDFSFTRPDSLASGVESIEKSEVMYG